MKTTLPTWSAGQGTQGAIAKETIRNWLLGRSRTRLPLPDFERLRADIESYAPKNKSMVDRPFCVADPCKR